MNLLKKADLSWEGQSIVELMQSINYGRIENLVVRHGEAVLDPPPRVVREIKFCAENGARPESARHDFTLKSQVLELFAHMEAMGNGVIKCLEIKHGLPFGMTVEEDAA